MLSAFCTQLVFRASLLQVFDKAIPGPGGDVPLRIYEPEGEGPFPMVVYFHGGGFVIGNNTAQGSLAANLAVACKAVVLAVDYRLAPEHPFPGAVEDGWAAVSWAAANAGPTIMSILHFGLLCTSVNSVAAHSHLQAVT